MDRGTFLQDEVVHGVKWSFVSQAWRQVVQLAMMLALARLLPPEDFGLFGMAAVAVNFVMQFKDLGTGSALIHRERLTDDLVSTVLWATVGFAVAALLLVALLAPLIADFFGDARLVAILSASMAGILFAAPGAVFQSLLERAMMFRRAALVEVLAVTVAAVLALWLAWTGFGVWALVVLSLATSVLSGIGMAVAVRWRPHLVFRASALKSLAGYSGSVLGFSFVNYWVRNADNALVGRYLGSLALGYYSLAYRAMLSPLQSVSSVVARVAFPAMSRMRGDVARTAAAYRRVMRLVAFVAFPVMAVAMGCAVPLTVTVLGTKWAPVAPILMWLAPVGMVQSVGATVGVVFQSLGRPDIPLKWSLWTAPIIVAGFALGLRAGPTGVAAAYCMVSVLLFPVSMLLALRLMDMDLGHLVKAVGPSLVCSVCAGGTAYLIAEVLLLGGGSSSIQLGVGVVGGMAAYLLSSAVFQMESLREVVSVARTALGRAASVD
jgi:PST family polysaccharide transporter